MYWVTKFLQNKGWIGIPTIEYSAGGTPTGLIDPRTGSLFAMAPSYSLANIPAASAVDLGGVIRIPKSEFTNNTGMPAWGHYLRTNGTQWVTAWEGQVFSEQWGTLASPLVNGFNPWNVANDYTLQAVTGIPGGNPTIPWQLMHIGLKIEIEAIFAFNTASATAVYNILFGKVNTKVAAPCGLITTAYSANRQQKLVAKLWVTSSTGYSCESMPTNNLPGSANPTEGYVLDRASAIDWSTNGNHYIVLGVDPGAAEALTTTLAYNVLGYRVRMMG